MPLYFVEKKNLLEEVFKNMSLPYSEKNTGSLGIVYRNIRIHKKTRLLFMTSLFCFLSLEIPG